MYHTLFPDYFMRFLAKTAGILGVPLQILQRIQFTEGGAELIAMVKRDQKKHLDAIYSKRYTKERSGGGGQDMLSADLLLCFAVARAYHPDCFGERGWKKMLSNLDIHQMLANFGCEKFPGRSTVHQHYGFLSIDSVMKLHQLILKTVSDEKIDDFSWLTMDSTAIASVSKWPVDSETLYRLLEKAYNAMQVLVDLRGKQKGWKSKVATLPLKSAQNLLLDLNLLKQQIDFAKGKKGAKKIRRRGYVDMCSKGEKLWNKLGGITAKLDDFSMQGKELEAYEEAMSQVYNRIYFVQKRFELATIDDFGDVEPELLLSFSDNDAVFIKKGGRETTFGYRPNICRSAEGFITSILVQSGNPADTTVLVPSVDDHIKQTSVVPALVSSDDGYPSDEGLQALIERGVHAFSASGAKGKRLVGDEVWELDLFKEMRRMRSNAEATISHYKRDFHMSRLSIGEGDCVEKEMMLRAISFNLELLGNRLQDRHSAMEYTAEAI